MRGAKGVVRALVPARKTRQAAKLPQATHAVFSAGQNFVRISLVAHVPHQAVFGCVEDIVQRDGEFNRAEVGA